MTSTALLGTTTLRPGIIIAQFSTLWECCAPNRSPPPLPERITNGKVNWPFVMYRLFAISLATMSQQTAKKSANMISATGRSPVMAAPIAAPRIACSRDRGVANAHRSELLDESDGSLEHSTRGTHVLAEEHDRLVSTHLLGDTPSDCFTECQLRHDPLPSAHTSFINKSSPGISPAFASSVERSTSSMTSCSMPVNIASSTPSCRSR